MIKINKEIQAKDLQQKLDLFWELSGEKIKNIDLEAEKYFDNIKNKYSGGQSPPQQASFNPAKYPVFCTSVFTIRSTACAKQDKSPKLT